VTEEEKNKEKKQAVTEGQRKRLRDNFNKYFNFIYKEKWEIYFCSSTGKFTCVGYHNGGCVIYCDIGYRITESQNHRITESQNG